MNDKTIEKIKKYGYTDVRLLSEGGHGQCFLVRDGKYNYKILKRYFKNDKKEAKHEEKVLGCIHGKTKGNAFFFKVDAITHEKETFLLMSTNEGKTLRELKDDVNENLSLFQATEIIISACYAISDLHKAKYVHMDVKPENLYFVPKTKQVVPLDFGSAKKLRKKKYSTIINSIGYCSTEGYMTKRLQEFCKKRELFSQINTTDEQKISLIEDEKKLGLQEDIYSLLCTYWFLLTNLNNWGVWNQDFCYLTTEEKIRLTLEKEDIPTYLISPLVELFMTIDAPCKDAEAEISFSSVFELITVFKKIKEIEAEKERHPAVILKKSLEHFSKDCNTTIKEELLCNILKKSSSSESEELSVSLAEYILNNLKNHNNIQLVSEGGAGKSFQLLFSCKKLLDVSAKEKIIPLYIPMNRYNGESHFIKDYIIAEYGWGKQNGQEDENNRNLLKDSIENHDYTFYLIIDSINESSAYPDVAYSEIKEISKWNNTKIIVASRNASELLSSFDQIGLQKLTNAYLKINIPDFKGLNQSLRGLLGLPFYFERYLKIDYADKGQITSAAELIETYHNWMLEKIKEKSVSPEKYSSFLEKLITKFLPEFSYKQLFNLHPLDFNDNDFMDSWNEFKTKNYVPFARDEHLHILEELGIIKSIGDKYAFCHQNTYTYFVAKYISRMIGENQVEGDSLLVDITDNYILRMVGELLTTSKDKEAGEHKFADKKSLDERKSPIEEKLDKYRGIFDNSTITRIIAKYVDIMKLCRGRSICAKLGNLNLEGVDLKHFDWSGSNFSNSVFSASSFNNVLLKSPINLVYYNEEKDYLIASDMNRDIILMDSYCNITHKFYHLGESANFMGIGDDFIVYGYYDGNSVYFDNSNLSYFGLCTGTTILVDDNEPLLMSVVCKHLKLKVFFTEDACGEKLLFVEEKSETIREVEQGIFIDGAAKYIPAFSSRTRGYFSEYEINNIIGPYRDGITMELDGESTFESGVISANPIYVSRSFISLEKTSLDDPLMAISGNLLITSLRGSWVFDLSKGNCTHINKSSRFRWIDSILISETHKLFIDRNNSDFYGNRVKNDISVRNNQGMTVLNITDVPIIPSQNCRRDEQTFMTYNSKDIYMCNFYGNEFIPFGIRKKGNILRGGCIWKNEVFYAICEEEGNLYLSITDMNKGMELIDMGIRLNASETETLINYDENQNMKFSKIAYEQDKIVIGVGGSRIIVYDIVDNSHFAISNDIFAISFYGILNDMADFFIQDNELFVLVDSYELEVYKLQMRFKNDLCIENTKTNLQIHQRLGPKEIVPLSYESGVSPMLLENFADILIDDEIYCSFSLKRIIKVLSDITIRNCNFNDTVIKTEEGEQPIPEEILFNT